MILFLWPGSAAVDARIILARRESDLRGIEARQIMIETSASERTAIAVRIPDMATSIDYRAYAQSIGNTPIIDTLLKRLRMSAPSQCALICVCETVSDLKALTAASRASEAFQTLQLQTVDDLQWCHILIDRLGLHRLIVTSLTHAVAPPGLIRDVAGLHKMTRAEITEATASWFDATLYIVESTAIGTLSALPGPFPAGPLPAAVRELRQRDPDRLSGVKIFAVDVPAYYRLEPSTCPEAVTLRSERDVEILREVFRDGADSRHHESLVEPYKRASTSVRARRVGGQGPSFKCARSRTSKMRVLYASSLSGFTGAQQSLCHLIGALDPALVEPLALTSYEGTFSALLRQNGATVVCPNHNLAKLDPENFVLAHRLLNECRPDIVHVNHSIGLPLLSAAMAADIPLVQHVRIQTPWRLGEHIAVADAVITVSRFVRGLVARLDVDMSKVHVILNGVNTRSFRPHGMPMNECRDRLGIPSDEFVILMIARFSKNKRHDTVMSAVGQLRKSIGRGHLLLVGATDGDRKYDRQIDAWREQAGLAMHMTSVDFMPDIRIAHYASNVMALPSEEEPLSRAVLEAMALGVPVIVGDSGGSQEVVEPGVNGFVVPCGSPEILARHLCELARNEDMALAIGAAGVRTVNTLLTSAQCAANTTDLYERVLSRPRSSELPMP